MRRGTTTHNYHKFGTPTNTFTNTEVSWRLRWLLHRRPHRQRPALPTRLRTAGLAS